MCRRLVHYVGVSVLFSSSHVCAFFFFFNDTATTEIYTLSLHDALPISRRPGGGARLGRHARSHSARAGAPGARRSEEHTSELQSPCNLVCRLLLEKKKSPQIPRQYTRRGLSDRVQQIRTMPVRCGSLLP